jgi:hypothetical protein
VAASRGYFQRTFGARLTFDIGQIEALMICMAG